MDNDSDALSKITINGQEFDVNEAQELIEKGRKTDEYEKKYNTKLDSVWPEYTRAAQERKQYLEELEQAKQKLQDYETKKSQDLETPADVLQARTAAKKLGIVLDDDLSKSGYIKKDELDKYLEEKDSKKEAQRQQTEQIVREAEKFEQDINGSDGRPKFKKSIVLPFMAQLGVNDMKQAYEQIYAEELDAWKTAQIEKEKRRGLKTMAPGGQKTPTAPRVTDSNFKEMLNEALYGNNEE